MTDEKKMKTTTITLEVPSFKGFTPTGRLETIKPGTYYYDGVVLRKWDGCSATARPHLSYTKDKWRAEKGGIYYTLTFLGGRLCTTDATDSRHSVDNVRFETGCYFKNEDKAEKALGHMLAGLNTYNEVNWR